MLNIIEYKEHLYNAAIKVEPKRDLQHFRMGGEKNGIRRYQNLDGSLTPEGRIHYGVGMSREEQAALKKYEDERQAQIDYDRSKSIREMSDEELQMAVARSRLESQFEQNMQNRANNFLQSQVTEETLNQQLDDLQYQKSQQRAERFMGRVERLAKFGANLYTQYGKVQDVKMKLEDVRAKKAFADQQEWLAKQNEEGYNAKVFNNQKAKEAYEYQIKKRDQADAEEAAEKAAAKERQSAKEAQEAAAKRQAESDYNLGYLNTKRAMSNQGKEQRSDFKPTYEKKVGDQYIYSDSVKKNWDSTKEQKKSGILSRVFGGKSEKNAEAKRAELREETKRQIKEYTNQRLGKTQAEAPKETPKSSWSAKAIYDGSAYNKTSPGSWSYFGQKAAKEAKQKSAWDSVHRNTTVDQPSKNPVINYVRSKKGKKRK